MLSSSVLTFLDFFGTAIFAISGALTAGRKQFDIFGVLVVALITAIGGGTLRDLVLNAHPIAWVENTAYLYVGMGAALSAFLVMRFYPIPQKALDTCDAVGLAFFAMAGIQKAQALGHGVEICLIMGIMTGVAGGVLRDIICNDIPLVMHKEVYAVAALAGGALYWFLLYLGLNTSTSMVAGMLTILILRLIGIYKGLSIPVLSVRD